VKKLIFFIALLPFFIGAQSVYRFNNYTINNGLSQSSVNTIVQDDNSALWIGTQDGLNRFDGVKFEIFNSDEEEGINNPFITSSAKTKDGKLWFGTHNGLTEYSPNTERFQTYTPNNKKNIDISSISIGEGNDLWIATLNQGIFRFDRDKKQFKLFNWGNSASDISSATYVGNSLIIRTGAHELFIYDFNSNSLKKVRTDVLGFEDFSILNISLVSDSNIYVGSNVGVFQLDIKSNCLLREFQDYPELQNIQVMNICLSQGQWFFATTGNGLYTIDERGDLINSTQDMFQKSALMYNDLNVLFEDKNKKLWIGSQRGISSFDPKYSGFIGVGPGANPKKSLPSPNVWTFTEDKSGNYLFVGTDLGMSRLDRKTGLFKHLNRWKKNVVRGTKEASFNVLSSYAVDSNTVLVGFEDGLFKLEINEDNSFGYTRLNYVNPIILSKYNRLYGIESLDSENYLLATKGAVFLYNIRTGNSKRFEHNVNRPKESLSPGTCRVIYKDRKGRMWFATSSGGINLLVKNETGNYMIQPHPINDAIRNVTKDYATALCDDEKGNLYLGTYGSGMLYVDFVSGEIKKIDKNAGLPNNIIYGILNDGKRIWISTNKGIASYNPSNMDVKSYLEVHGLVSNEFNSNAFFNSSNGELFFGSIYGYNVFRPNELNIANTEQEVIITKFKLNGGWLKPGQEGSPLKQPIAKTSFIELPYTDRSFTIRFQTSDLSNPQLTQFKFELIGSVYSERFIEKNREITFNSLSPGDYQLKIYAKLGEGSWSKKPKVLEISILPPYWGTWWFWTIVALIISVLAFLFFKRRIESERREQVKLEIKVTERTREISNQKSRIEEQSKLLEAEKNNVVLQQELLQVEKDNAERWLANALPEEVVRELKVNGKVEANAFDKVTVMFTDVVGFTNISRKMRPSRLVKRLDVLFKRFDELIQNNDLEKIKTIGDAYMCAGGIPIENSINPMNACIAALQIQDYMSKLKFDAIANHSDYWEIRLGIHTGPVIAGIIGDLKLAYDVWGPTVNQAQQMEKFGAPGEVTVSGTTFTFIEPYFECVPKGKVNIKGGIEVDMYSVLKIKPELSEKGEGLFPNNKFSEIVELHHFSSIKYYKTEHFVLDYLKAGLSDKLLYHSVNHSIDVVQAVERIALSEGVTDEGLFLLKTAAILHDAGFVKQYENNESIGAEMAAEWLPKYGYTEQHIKTIVELIHVTEIPHKPINKLQEIICDADLDYLGRDDFEQISNRLRLELRGMGKIDSDRAWDKIQVDFLKKHKFFTKTSISARRKKKKENLKVVIKRLDKDAYED
jgi:class 3 adenylate cyclase/ligand-binding sensor domain-containing protein/predicted metal-dependent HD superfamily phosphohydrolase